MQKVRLKSALGAIAFTVVFALLTRQHPELHQHRAGLRAQPAPGHSIPALLALSKRIASDLVDAEREIPNPARAVHESRETLADTIAFEAPHRAEQKPKPALMQKTQAEPPPAGAVIPPAGPPAPSLSSSSSQDAPTSRAWEPGSPLPFPLKKCSIVLFRHLAKTGGSTVQAVFRKNEQLGDFAYASHGSWIEVRPPEWNVLIQEITADFDGFIARHPRLLVSFHKQTAEQFAPAEVPWNRLHNPTFHIWEDIARMRQLYTQRGCGFVLSTMLRRPDPDLYLSDYLFEGTHTGKPLAQWMGRDIQMGALLGWPYGWNSRERLTREHELQALQMLDSFDVVGLTEHFAESMLLIARAAGIPNVQYRVMNANRGNPQEKTALLADTAQRRALSNLSAFDTKVYDLFARRFAETASKQDDDFKSLVRKFSSSAKLWRNAKHYGGKPPNDKYMVTSDYLCPKYNEPTAKVDYGGCDVQLGQKGGPPSLFDLKTYVPCAAVNCTKAAATTYACAHNFPTLGAMMAKASTVKLPSRALLSGGSAEERAAAMRSSYRAEAGRRKDLSVPKPCSVESSPDAFM